MSWDRFGRRFEQQDGKKENEKNERRKKNVHTLIKVCWKAAHRENAFQWLSLVIYSLWRST